MNTIDILNEVTLTEQQIAKYIALYQAGEMNWLAFANLVNSTAKSAYNRIHAEEA